MTELPPEIIDAGTKIGVDLAKNLLTSQLEKVRRAMGLIKAKTDLEELFENYWRSLYKRHSILRALALARRQVPLRDVYLPLTLRSMHGASRIRIDNTRVPGDLPKVTVICDSAGAGKSTLLKFLLSQWLETRAVLPIYLELRRLRPSVPLLQSLEGDLAGEPAVSMNSLVLHQAIQKGGFVLFLDGLDEIPSRGRETVLRELQKFLLANTQNRVLLTSRPDDGLDAIPASQVFSIEPLTEIESKRLIHLYDRSGQIADGLIAEVEKRRNYVQDFLQNPLLTSLLYTAYEYRTDVPLKKHLFYRQVYDALFSSHDASKEVGFVREHLAHLANDDLHRLLRSLAILMSDAGEGDIGKDAMLRLIERAVGLSGCQAVEASAVLQDLLVSVPLMLQDGLSYRWTHRAMGEYFTAQFVCTDTGDMRGTVLRQMARGRVAQRWANVLDLCCDIDERFFRQTIERDMLRAWSDWMSTSEEGNERAIERDAVRERYALSFFCRLTCVDRRKTALADRAGISGQLLVSTPEWDVYSETSHWQVVASILASRGRDYLATRPRGDIEKVVELPLFNDRYLGKNGIVLLTEDPKAAWNRPEVFESVSDLYRCAVSVAVRADVAELAAATIEIEGEERAKGLSGVLDSLLGNEGRPTSRKAQDIVIDEEFDAI